MHISLSKRSLLIFSILIFATSGYYYYNKRFKQFSKSHGSLLMRCKKLTPIETQTQLGPHLLDAKIKPIHISIQNNSKRNLAFSLGDINAKAIPAQNVAKQASCNTTGRAIGWGIAGLFMPLFWIVGALHYCLGREKNKNITHNFLKHSLSEHCVWPGTKLDGMIFVNSKDQHDLLKICLTDTVTGEKIACTVDLTKHALYNFQV